MVKRNSILPWVWPLTYLGPLFAASVLWAWVTLGVPGGTVPTAARLTGAVLFAVAVTSGVLRISPRISEHVEWFEGSLVERVTSFLFYLTICFVFALLVTGVAVLVIAPSQTARLYAVAVGFGLVGTYVMLIVTSDEPYEVMWVLLMFSFGLSTSVVVVTFILDRNPLFENMIGGVAVGLLSLLTLSVIRTPPSDTTIPLRKVAVVLFGISGLIFAWATIQLGLDDGQRAAGTAGAILIMAFGGLTGLYIFLDNDGPMEPGGSLTVEWILGSVGGSVGVLGLGVGIPDVLLSVDASIAFIYAVGVLVAAVGFFFFIIENGDLYTPSFMFAGGLIMGLVTLDWIAPEVAPVVVLATIVLTGFSAPLGLLLVAYTFDEVALIVLPVFVLVCGVGLLLTAPVAVVLGYLFFIVMLGLGVMFAIGGALY